MNPNDDFTDTSRIMSGLLERLDRLAACTGRNV
jgi:hypothetical protein